MSLLATRIALYIRRLLLQLREQLLALRNRHRRTVVRARELRRARALLKKANPT